MKASFQWLRALLPDLPDDPKQVAARLTAAGLEVEAMATYGEGIAPCVVARVVATRPHPSRSGLRLVTVDRGAGGPEEVVCGAPNVPDPPGLAVFAPLGTHLPAKQMTIERRTIGGVVSEGMLCSEEELGLTDDHSGILVLPPGTAEAGTPLVRAVPAVTDTIFDMSLTPNRPDALGHIGLARELGALFGLAWKPPVVANPARAVAGNVEELVRIVIQAPDRCAQYGARVLGDVQVGPSPLWLRYRLASLGVRPISNVVDITNFVMLEYGHPMHAFDLDRVRGQTIVVRRARDGEVLTTLDGIERTLGSDDLVICDAEGPVALAGIMGGGESEIYPTTRRVLFECAHFDARGVRRTARRHGIHTESSHRFERGVDPGDTLQALARTAALTSSLSGGSALGGALIVMPAPLAPKTITLRPARIEQLLGVHIPFDEAMRILTRLGFLPQTSHDGATEFSVPTHRPDCAREVDLIEEVARVHGFDAVPTVLPAIRASRDPSGHEALSRRTREAATAMGLSEALTYSFVSSAVLEALSAPPPSVALRNPMSDHRSVMRTSLLPGLLEAVARARRHDEPNVRLFTVGPVFLGGLAGELPEERLMFAAVLAGDRTGYLTRPEPVDVWDAKGLALGLLERLRIEARVAACSADDRSRHLHPRAAGKLLVGTTAVGLLGLMHPDVGDALDIGGDVVVVEVDLAALATVPTVPVRVTPVPRFPASTRDIALVVHDEVPAGEVEAAVRAAAGSLAEQVVLFDRFVGANIPERHASLAFHVVYRAPDRTLTDAEVDARHANVVAEVEARFGAVLRA